MHLEEFARGDSFLHRLDPRVKLAAAFVWSCMTAANDNPVSLASLLGVGVFLLASTRLPWRRLLARMAFVNLFTAFFWLSLPFSMPGEQVFSLGPLQASRQGILLALVITLKCNAALTALTALLGTSTVFALVHALRHFALPEKLIDIFFLSFRYFQVIHSEYLRLREAMRARCFRPGTDRRSYTTYAQIMGMLLVRSLDRAERVREAMICRGYAGRLWVFDHFALTKDDVLFCALFFPACALHVFLT